MKKYPFISLLLLVLFAHKVNAANLCDASCNLTIDFSGGGSIEAIETLTITFGDNALVDTGVTTTSYVNGDTLVLNAGEKLDFLSGGSFDIGSGGNIDYTSMNINADGSVSLQAIDGTQTVSLHGNTILTISTLELNSDASASGNVMFANSSLTIGSGSIPDFNGTGSISIEAGGQLTVGSLIYDQNSLPFAVSTIDISAIGSGTISAGGLTIVKLTPEALATLEGVTLPAADGNSCTVTNGECVTASGAKYVVNTDGELVAADDGGALSFYLLLLAGSIMFRCRKTVFVE